jgi:uncharacterized protein YcbX
LKAVSLTQATLEEKGLQDDRRFMLVIPAPVPAWGHFRPGLDPTHRFLTQRQCPSLARIQATWEDSKQGYRTLVLSSDLLSSEDGCRVPVSSQSSPDSPLWQATLWDDIVTVRDMGDSVARFITRVATLDSEFRENYLAHTDEMELSNQPDRSAFVRLVQQVDHLPPISSSSTTTCVIPRTANDAYVPHAARTLTGDSPTVSLADGFAILIANQASLDDLNQRLQQKGASPIPMAQFRPNVVVTGAPAFDEDTWKVIAIDGVLLHVVKGCPRCKQSCTDQSTGVVRDEPLLTLAEYRACMPDRPQNVFFAQNALPYPDSVGTTVRGGAQVEVIERGEPVWGD